MDVLDVCSRDGLPVGAADGIGSIRTIAMSELGRMATSAGDRATSASDNGHRPCDTDARLVPRADIPRCAPTPVDLHMDDLVHAVLPEYGRRSGSGQ